LVTVLQAVAHLRDQAEVDGQRKRFRPVRDIEKPGHHGYGARSD
jgi:hypothetical protein